MQFTKLASFLAASLSLNTMIVNAAVAVVRAPEPEAGGEGEQLIARGPNSQWSFYDVEAQVGSCGRVEHNSDFVVAMNSHQMTSSMCFKKIKMTFGGKTTTAVITDTCPTCPNNGLDLSEGLFTFFAGSLSAGIITGDWETT